jgi:hypothetical protein
MTRDTAIWTMVVCLIIPAGGLGILRGLAIMRAYRGIYKDLKNAGIKVSQAELQVLIRQLWKNPKAVVASDAQEVSRRIKERHVNQLLSSLKPYRYGFVALFLVVVVAGLLIDYLFPPNR